MRSKIVWRVMTVLGLCLLGLGGTRGEDWPQWRGVRGEGVWRETGLVDRLPAGGPPVKWRAPLGGGYSGPAVAAGRVYVMDHGAPESSNTTERVVCLEAGSGQPVWTHAYPCRYTIAYAVGPRATPLVDGARVYTLGAMGDLLCLDAARGTVIWQKNLPQAYAVKVPAWGYATQLLVEGDRLVCIVGGPGHAVVALDKASGQELWRALSSGGPGYSAPVIRTVNGRRQLIVWHSDGLAGLDPASGAVLWTAARPARMGMAICTPAVFEDRVCVSDQWSGTALFQIRPGASEAALLWKAGPGPGPEASTPASAPVGEMNNVMGTILFDGHHIYGVSMYGNLCCLDAATGRRVWSALDLTGGVARKDRWFTGFLVPQADRCWIFTETGDLLLTRLSGQGLEILSRAQLQAPEMPLSGPRKVIWSHPAFADRCLWVRNHHELTCYSLAAP